MKSLILALSLAVASVGMLPAHADAKRLGGGGSSGMQRSTPTRAPDAAPARPAQPTQAAPATAGAAPAAAPKRSWMGPIAGLAAGLGIAALMGHMGLGAGFGNIIMMVLLAAVAFFAIRFVMSRFGGSRPMVASNGMQFAGGREQSPQGGIGSGWGGPATTPAPSALPAVAPAIALGAAETSASSVAGPSNLPAGFDVVAFERIAKMIFIRMQAANDTADLNDLRTFTTPEMFASIKLDLQDRGSSAQQTDVVKIDAEVLDFAAEADRQIVSARFHGLIREEKDGVAAPFNEIWHLVKPTDGSREWAIAGIQQAH
ncbi:MAG: Tim44 domain-containing protein [Bacteriovorax sp.]|nr:Tim44 domain-containing protein [Rhizobacter sp.]